MAVKLRDAVVVVGERRVDAAEVAIRHGAEVIILDDGFQHRYLHRDLEILVFDSTYDLSNELLLPVGRMREPFCNVRRAQLVTLSHVREASEEPPWHHLLRRWYGGSVVKFRYRSTGLRRAVDNVLIPSGTLQSREVLVFSGIGRNDHFLDSVTEAGLTVCGTMRFSDHHDYTDKDIWAIAGHMDNVGAKACVTTEKDLIRMRAGSEPVQQFLHDHQVFSIPVEVEMIEGASIMHRLIDDCLEMRQKR